MSHDSCQSSFHSILYDRGGTGEETIQQPVFFTDLNLDQVVNAVTKQKQEYDLKPFFYTPLHDVDTIYYRQQVMRDMEEATLRVRIKDFTEAMIMVRRSMELTEKLFSDPHKQGRFLEAALSYCAAVIKLARTLELADPKSQGLSSLHDYVKKYISSNRFESLRTEAQAVKDGLKSVRYCVLIRSGKFSVRRYEQESDYSKEVEETFAKFKQGAAKDYMSLLDDDRSMNHIEIKILEFVVRLYPEQFTALEQFCDRYRSFTDETLLRFYREVQFYIAYLEFITEIKDKNFIFCYPQVKTNKDELFVRNGFDLALARSRLYTEFPVICNDFSLQGQERIIVVNGPNQGGKTTFARMFGQLHYLAVLGCPVPGRKAQLFLFDQIFTHFEREEDIRSLRGKLQDDLVRIHDILTHATPESLLIVNEIFASTTLQDAIFLSRKVMTGMIELDLPAVWVTFIDELSSLSEKTVSMVSTVVRENPVERTFKIIRKPPDGLAYALSIAQKYRLTYEQIKQRIEES